MCNLIRFLSGCHCACMDRIILCGGGVGWVVWFPLLSFSQRFHGGREVPVLLLRLVYFYLLISALLTAERSVTSVHEDVSVITEWFLAEETSIQEMGLVVLLKPGVTEPPRSRRKRRRRRKRSHGGRNVSEAATPPCETHRPWIKRVVGPGKPGFHISQRGQPIVLVDETRPPYSAGNWFHFLWSSDDLSAGMRLAEERTKRRTERDVVNEEKVKPF